MDPEALLLLLSLIERAASATTALMAAKDVLQKAHDEGRQVTLEDFKQYELADDEARKVLVEAINAAET